MEKEFVPYELAVKLKALGFDEPCFGYYDGNHNFNYMFEGKPENFSYRKFPLGHSVGWTSAPTFSQAFRWFREKYGVHSSPRKYDETKWWVQWGSWTSSVFETFEEAELAWLDKLIEMTHPNK